MPTAYSYIRFSTLEQRKGDSLRRQLQLAEDYARENGLTLDTTFKLHDLGVSAYRGKNREEGRLYDFLEAVKGGRVAGGSYLLLESLDRLSRQRPYSAMATFTSILDLGITIVTLLDKQVYSSNAIDDDPMRLMSSILIMMRANEESETKSRRVKAAWAEKRKNVAKKKLTNRCPLWMTLNEEKTQFHLLEDRVEVVRTIVRWSKEGMGQAQIAKRLNEHGVHGFSDPTSMWQPSYVNKILTSTSLFGLMQPKVWDGKNSAPTGEPVKDYYPAIISEAEFHHLQAVRAKRRLPGGRVRKGTDMPNLFSGIVKCAYCGSSMVLATAPGPRKTSTSATATARPPTKYLVCDGARRGNGCHAVQWNYKSFETSFLEYCKGVDFLGLLDQISGAGVRRQKRQVLSEQLQLATGERAVKQAATKRYLDLFELDDAKPTLETKQRLQQIADDVHEIEKRIGLIEQDLQVVDRQTSPDEGARLFRDFAEKLDLLTKDEVFRLRVAMSEQVKGIVRKVDMYPAGRLIDGGTADRMRHDMLEMGFEQERVDAYMEANVRTQPKRQGRGGRGRYVSIVDSDRIFVIYTHGDQMRIVRPAFDDPCGLLIGHDWHEIGNQDHVKSMAQEKSFDLQIEAGGIA
jgi:DNA invertase Pin-like site-specific DNA recombinase